MKFSQKQKKKIERKRFIVYNKNRTYNGGVLCHKKLISWRLTKGQPVRGRLFLIKRANKLPRVKKSLLRFFHKQAGLSTMQMRFGILCSRSLQVPLSKVALSQIRLKRLGLPINGRQRLCGIKKADYPFTMRSFGSLGKQLL